MIDRDRQSVRGRAPWADRERSGSAVWDPVDLSNTERVCILTRHLLAGEQLTVTEAARLTGLSASGARNTLRSMSRVLELLCEHGKWQLLK